MDLAIHYISAYKMPLRDPQDILATPVLMPLGNNFLLMGRLGFRVTLGGLRNLEFGLLVRTPLGESFREYAGVPFPASMRSDTGSDFGGELVGRRVSFYLRGSL